MDEREPYHDVGPGLEGLEGARTRGKERAREFNLLEDRELRHRAPRTLPARGGSAEARPQHDERER